MATIPPVHHWTAGEAMNDERMNEVTDAINWIRNPPMVHVSRQLTNQSIAVTTWTSVSFDTLDNNYDPYGMFDPGTPTQITCTVPGWYMVEGVMIMDNTPAVNARLTMALWKASTEMILRYDQQALDAIGGNVNFRKEASMFLNVGDTVQLRAHISAGARNMLANGAAEHPQMRLRWVSN
jgi:hypothetical protein